MSDDYNQKYCILGGGAAGIGMAKCFTQAEIPYDIIERDSDFGGNWNFNLPGSKMYESTHLISSKTNTQYSDFPMPAHFPSYPDHNQMLEYLKMITTHFKINEHVEFNTEVSKLEPIGDFWKVVLSTGEERLYKGVIVCNGLLRETKMPEYPG